MQIQHLWKPLVPGAIYDISSRVLANFNRKSKLSSRFLDRVANHYAWNCDSLTYEQKRNLSEEAARELSCLQKNAVRTDAHTSRTRFYSKVIDITTYVPALYTLSLIATNNELNFSDPFIFAAPIGLGLRYWAYQYSRQILKLTDEHIEKLEAILNASSKNF